MPDSGSQRRWETAVRGLSALVIATSALVLVQRLPVETAVHRLEGVVRDLGNWGPVAFAAAYVVAGLLLVPGAALTLAAGALFGLVGGTVTVSAASTTVAAAAFLVARHAGRARVSRMAREHPRFGAIDRAIHQGGFRVVALLRLSPVIPFSLSNYLYGLTDVRFGPYLLASWLAMLPGTFMYVYLGHVGAQGLAAASGGGPERTPGEWALLLVGGLATVAVTIYVTRLAQRAMREGTAELAPGDASPEPTSGQRARPWSTVALACTALVAASTAGCAWARPGWLSGMFGPPAVQMEESYADADSGVTFDHARFDALLHEHVREGGAVDYDGLARDVAQLDAYVESLAAAPLERLGRDERLALLLDAYNAFTLKLILDHRPLASIRDIPDAERWDARRWVVGGQTWSLNQIEHEQIRPHFAEPRVHFALVCAAIGCPPLRSEAYVGSQLEAQLADQARYVHTRDRWFRYDAPENVLHLTKLYDWYGGDFVQAAGSVPAYAALWSAPLAKALHAGRAPEIRWLDYDWRLNSVENVR